LNAGLPLAIILLSALAMTRVIKKNLLICTLGSLQTMGNASVLCIDKTGTLTQNEMTVVAASFGAHAKFVRKLDKNIERVGREERNARDFVVALSQIDSSLTPKLVELFNASITINSTAFEGVDPDSGRTMYIGNKTETALLKFAKELGWANPKSTRNSADVIQMIPFSSDRKSTGCVVQLPNGGHRLYIKGASEILTRKCTRCVVVYRDAAKDKSNGEVETVPIGDFEEDVISHTISSYASQSLRTIALCYRDFSHWPPAGAGMMADDVVSEFCPVRVHDT
jgi:P-type Ca2+ transporter type 2C